MVILLETFFIFCMQKGNADKSDSLISIGFSGRLIASWIMACKRTALVVVPSPASSKVCPQVFLSIFEPLSSSLSVRIIFRDIVAPSFVNFGSTSSSIHTLRPFGPSVPPTVLAATSKPHNILSKGLKEISLLISLYF